MKRASEIWIIDDDQSIRWVLSRALERDGMQVLGFGRGEEALRALATRTPDAVITDIRMPDLDGLAVLELIAAERPSLPVIIMTAYSDLDSAVSAFRGGAFEYLPKPFDVDEALELVRKAVRSPPRGEPASTLPESSGGAEILGSAAAMQTVFRAIGRLARSHITVLITGESGTGKELVARALHQHSPRDGAPFIAMNAAAIPRDLLESELFGHERCAFTGAQSLRHGRFEQANGGALFLDEIGDMPAELQARLLRVLAEGEFYRVGGHVPIKVDVRVIAATHQPLERKVAEGEFREDLYHRLNVIRIRIPSLRERREDIPELARHFLRNAALELGVESKALSGEVELALSDAPWPGNVRQLENTCRWLTVMAPGKEISLGDLPPELLGSEAKGGGEEWTLALERWADRRFADGEHDVIELAQPAFEKVLIRAALGRAAGRRQLAARLIGWGRNTLTRKIQALGPDLDSGAEISGTWRSAGGPPPRNVGDESDRGKDPVALT